MPGRQWAEATAQLRGLIPGIMSRWEARVRAEVPGAAEQKRPVLYDDVPAILAEITQALALDQEALFTDSAATRRHAHQRLRLRAYSVQEIIQEYQILRQVLMEVLREEVPLDPDGAALVHVVLDQSIQEAVTEYVTLQQEELRESEERYRLLVEGVKDYAIFMLDPHGCVTSWNEGARRIFGYTAEEIVGASFARLFTADDRAAVVIDCVAQPRLASPRPLVGPACCDLSS